VRASGGSPDRTPFELTSTTRYPNNGS